MNDTQAPDVSVVIPTYARGEQLQRAVRTALAQDGVRFEIIVVDDGSPEALVSRAVQAAWPESVRSFLRPTRGGPGAARNDGIRLAKAPWIAFLDDDDLWSPNKLRLQLAAARASGADFVYGRAVVVDPAGRVLHEARLPAAGRFAQEIVGDNALMSGPSNIMVRSDLIRESGGFRTDLSFYADWEMWIRLSRLGRAARVDEVCVAYFDHSGSMTRTGAFDLDGELRVLIQHHPSLLAQGGRPDHEHLLRLRASHARKEGRRVAAMGDYLRAARWGRPVSNASKAAVCLLPRVPHWAEAARKRYIVERTGEAGALDAFRRVLRSNDVRDDLDWVRRQLLEPHDAFGSP